MKKLLTISLIAELCSAFIVGCNSPGKVRDIDLKGMYINGYTETLAIGQGKLTSIPGEREAMAAHYEEDVAWLSPQKKTHSLDLFLVGSNTVSKADKIIESICNAFADVAPAISSNNVATSGSTAFDLLSASSKNHAEVDLAKAAAGKVATAATSAATSSAAGSVSAAIPDNLKESITRFFTSRGGDTSKAKIYYDTNNVLTMTDGTTTVECAGDGVCRECGDK